MCFCITLWGRWKERKMPGGMPREGWVEFHRQ